MDSSMSSSPGLIIKHSETINDRIKRLYPAVNLKETPLPKSWSTKDKFNYIGLSQNNLRVHYKGAGKNHKDAASIRATNAIPASCGVYYFEVKIISKGRDGFMGIGLSSQGNNMNRLPGWDKHTFGYHGDDGNSFCQTGTGKPYGPTYTTGDVIGCCINLIDHSCFYTKNGLNLGIAFTDLPPNLYPTVGLQTPGEVVEANFGQQPFVFDIEDYMKEFKLKTRSMIEDCPVPSKKGEWQTALQQIVSTYLVHHGYSSTAESFARSTGQSFEEEVTSIKNRQRIQKLVLGGRMSEAIETTQSLYPGLLERNANLLFMLKCRQFIEMISGSDCVTRGPYARSPRSRHGSGSKNSSPSMSPVHHANHHTNVHSVKLSNTSKQGSQSPHSHLTHQPNKSQQQQPDKTTQNTNCADLHTISESHMNETNCRMNGESSSGGDYIATKARQRGEDMETDNGVIQNGTSNGVTPHINGDLPDGGDDECDMDVDKSSAPQKLQLCGGNPASIERMLLFGKELQTMSIQLKREYGKNETNKRALQDAFSLIAYSDPWDSPVGYQLDPIQREPVCAALNSAILESHGLPKQPPLELAVGQVSECMKIMSNVGIGSCAFASVQDYFY